MNSVERVKQICKERKIPISRLERDLGYSNGYIGQLRKGVFPADRLSEIAKYLELPLEYLMTGNEPEEKNSEPALTPKDERDIAKKLTDTLNQLDANDGLMFDGEVLDEKTKELLRISLENSLRIGKANAKKTYTPKKYRGTQE